MAKLISRRFIFAVLITLSFFSFQSAHAASLTTLFASNNMGSFGGGIYFDLENVGSMPITITSWDVNVSSGTDDVAVWYRTGTSQGFEQTTDGWQLLGTDSNVVSQGVDQPTPVNVGGLTIFPGDVFGIAMAGGMQWRYTNWTSSNRDYNDGLLEIRTVSATNVAFGSPRFFPRVWNGTIYYRLSGSIPTVSEWGLIIFSLLLAGAGYWIIPRRQKACA